MRVMREPSSASRSCRRCSLLGPGRPRPRRAAARSASAPARRSRGARRQSQGEVGVERRLMQVGVELLDGRGLAAFAGARGGGAGNGSSRGPPRGLPWRPELKASRSSISILLAAPELPRDPCWVTDSTEVAAEEQCRSSGGSRRSRRRSHVERHVQLVHDGGHVPDRRGGGPAVVVRPRAEGAPTNLSAPSYSITTSCSGSRGEDGVGLVRLVAGRHDRALPKRSRFDSSPDGSGPPTRIGRHPPALDAFGGRRRQRVARRRRATLGIRS